MFLGSRCWCRTAKTAPPPSSSATKYTAFGKLWSNPRRTGDSMFSAADGSRSQLMDQFVSHHRPRTPASGDARYPASRSRISSKCQSGTGRFSGLTAIRSHRVCTYSTRSSIDNSSKPGGGSGTGVDMTATWCDGTVLANAAERRGAQPLPPVPAVAFAPEAPAVGWSALFRPVTVGGETSVLPQC